MARLRYVRKNMLWYVVKAENELFHHFDDQETWNYQPTQGLAKAGYTHVQHIWQTLSKMEMFPGIAGLSHVAVHHQAPTQMRQL